MPGLRSRALWSLLAAACLALGAVAALGGRVPDQRETPLVDPLAGWPRRAIPLLETAGPPPPVYVLRFRNDNPAALFEAPELRLLFTTYDNPLELKSASLEFIPTACKYETRAGATFAAGEELSFVRGSGCAGLPFYPALEIQLVVELASRARIALWASLPQGVDVDRDALRILLPGPPMVAVAKRIAPLPDSGTRRIDLLNHLWQLSPAPGWIWVWLALAIASFGAGAALLGLDAPSLAGRAILAGAGATGLAAGLSLGYAVLVPPFQAPDEPDHLLSFAAITNRPELSTAAERWAALMHFERVRFNLAERFRPGDVHQPYPIPWAAHSPDDAVHAEDVAARSVTAYRLWMAFGRLRPPTSVQRTLFDLRVLNACIFAAAIGLACALIVWCTGAARARLAWAPFLLVPALPFFGMHLSEFSVLAALYVVVAACVLVFFQGGPRSHYAGLILGVAGALAMASGRSVAPMLPLLAAVFAGRAMTGQHNTAGRIASVLQAATCWAGVPVAGLVFVNWCSAEYWQSVSSQAARLHPALAGMLSETGLVSLAAALGAAGFLSEIGIARLRARQPGSQSGGRVRAVAYSAALLVAGSMLVSIYRVPGASPASTPSDGAYVAQVVRNVAASFRLRDPDPLLSSGFWAGFGWLDTAPPWQLIVSLTTVTAFVLVLTLWRLGRTGDSRRVALGVIYGAGWWTSLVLYALSAMSLARVVSGRYLIGLYLCAIVLAWSGLMGSPAGDDKPSRSQTALQVAALLGCAALHAYCWMFLLRRYF